MYLTELYRFYDRMTQDPQSGMPPEGMSAEAIHFALVIGEDGSLKGVHDLRDSKGKPLRRFVPAAVSRSSNVAANFLWDKTSYVLGIDGRDDSCPSPEKRQSFLALHHERFDACPDRHAKALLAFLDHWRPEMLHSLPERQALLDSNLVFRLQGEEGFLHEHPALQRIWLDNLDGQECPQGQCLVTGREG